MARERRQYVRFAFYRLAPEWRRLSPSERERMRREFTEIVVAWDERILRRPCSPLGRRGDCDFMLWQVSEHLDHFQQLASDVASSDLGAYHNRPSCRESSRCAAGSAGP